MSLCLPHKCCHEQLKRKLCFFSSDKLEFLWKLLKIGPSWFYAYSDNAYIISFVLDNSMFSHLKRMVRGPEMSPTDLPPPSCLGVSGKSYPFSKTVGWGTGSIKKNCVGLHCRLDGGALSHCINKTAVGAVVPWIMEHFHMCASIFPVSSSHLSPIGIWLLSTQIHTFLQPCYNFITAPLKPPR